MRRRFAAALGVGALVLGLVASAPVTAQTDGPATIEVGGSGWRVVSAGDGHTCGIRTSGRLYCWGEDGWGQLGDGGTDTSQPTPVQVAGGATNWTQVSAGGFHTCARRSTGRLYCWGSDSNGQLGDGGTNTDQSIPVQVSGGATNWTQVSAGRLHTCARRSTGRLYCWGYDAEGQLGDGGTNTDRPTPVEVAGDATNWTQVDAGGYGHTCARRSTGRLFCWGYDVNGELGNGGANANRATPVQVAGGATNWTQVSLGTFHTCARRSTGRLYCWGKDLLGQLGSGNSNGSQPTPVLVAGGATNWSQVAAGDGHTCARRSTGRLYCWGGDNSGQIGDGGTNTDQPTPVQVAGGATDWVGPTVGGFHSCARTTTGRLFCWGIDSAGQLGDGGTNTGQPAPVQVAAP